MCENNYFSKLISGNFNNGEIHGNKLPTEDLITENFHLNPVFIDGFSVRRKVFIEEQNISESIEADSYDQLSIHTVIYKGTNSDSKPVATGRLVYKDNQFQIGRVCVLPHCRGLGLGAKVMEVLCQKGFLLGADRIYLHSQLSAKDFYEKLGFISEGQVYEEAGIPHITMFIEKVHMD